MNPRLAAAILSLAAVPSSLGLNPRQAYNPGLDIPASQMPKQPPQPKKRELIKRKRKK